MQLVQLTPKTHNISHKGGFHQVMYGVTIGEKCFLEIPV